MTEGAERLISPQTSAPKNTQSNAATCCVGSEMTDSYIWSTESRIIMILILLSSPIHTTETS